MRIDIDTKDISGTELRALIHFLSVLEGDTDIKVNPQEAAEVVTLAAVPEPKRKRRTKAEMAAEEPAPDTEEDLATEEEPASDGPTLQEAVKVASELLSSGQEDKVRAALASVGAARVSEIAQKDLGAFIDALSS